MRLREWQDRFQQDILQAREYDGLLLDNLLPGSTGKQTQLAIYRNAYVIRLGEALRSNYPALHQLLGDDDFAALARAYLDQHPPAHASIRWFGDALALFLEHHAPYDGLPVLSELARFEWALRHTIDAADAEVITVESLQAIAPQLWGELQFVLHPSATVMALQWNTPQIWQALTAEEAPPGPEKKAMNWLVHRQPDLVGAWRSVSELELAALGCLAGGGSFSDICEAVAALAPAEGEGALRSAEILRLWVEQGLISIRHE
jgi:hypothetical protein